MTVGDPGPYMESMDGGHIWVPRTVPYLKARQIAKEAVQYGDRLVYHGKAEATLFGYTFDCQCDDTCERGYDEFGDKTRDDDEDCRVPVWHFESAEAR